MEKVGWWSIDREPNGLEKTWCCLSITARDLAKIGRLYLRGGDWEGQQIVSQNWFDPSPWVATGIEGREQYHYNWWLLSDHEVMGIGKDGQYLYIDSQTHTIIVRYGRSMGDMTESEWIALFRRLSAAQSSYSK